jgi:hypothetical protein
MTFEKEQGGQDSFLWMGPTKSLINLKVGPKEKEITFLVDSGAARPSLTMGHLPSQHPPAYLSLGQLPISGVKGKEFHVALFKCALVKFQDQLT